jgi:hypothetical protein
MCRASKVNGREGRVEAMSCRCQTMMTLGANWNCRGLVVIFLVEYYLIFSILHERLKLILNLIQEVAILLLNCGDCFSDVSVMQVLFKLLWFHSLIFSSGTFELDKLSQALASFPNVISNLESGKRETYIVTNPSSLAAAIMFGTIGFQAPLLEEAFLLLVIPFHKQPHPIASPNLQPSTVIKKATISRFTDGSSRRKCCVICREVVSASSNNGSVPGPGVFVPVMKVLLHTRRLADLKRHCGPELWVLSAYVLLTRLLLTSWR